MLYHKRVPISSDIRPHLFPISFHPTLLTIYNATVLIIYNATVFIIYEP